jgi:membrane AbrB-like protein
MFGKIFQMKPALWWGVLLLLSTALGGALSYAHLPAGVLLGCMLAGIVLSSHEIRLSVPSPLFVLAQGLIGCLMARSLHPSMLIKVASDWPIFLGASVLIIAASAGLGWILMRRHILPGTTAVWGLAPGAASAMVLMADAYGADARLVAFMQYLRVVMVTVLASVVARLWTSHAPAAASEVPWFAVASSTNLAWTLVLAFGASSLARLAHIPAGPLLVPMLLGTALQGAGSVSIELPAGLLALAYAVVGWSIGLRFTRAILIHAWRALPKVLGAICVLIGIGIVLAAGLTQLAGFEPLTAYLATSPGGADSVAIIAATSTVDAGFVMAMQLTRFLMVLVFGPGVSRLVAGRMQPASATLKEACRKPRNRSDDDSAD